MKILHTADWHLGKYLERFDRLAEQQEVLEEIVTIADEEEVDLILIAGDLFDNFNPKTKAVELFYKTLKRLSKDGQRPVIGIAGNHDSPSFIDAPDPLARACGIILIGYPQATVASLSLAGFSISKSDKGFIELQIKGIDFPVRLIHTPFANELRLKEYFGEQKEAEELNQVLANHWSALSHEYCDAKGVNLLMTHLYMNKKGGSLLEEPEGEKPLMIGHADMIYAEAVPADIQYTALGHLHGFKNIGTEKQPAVYASSPLCYSFSEAGQQKFVAIVEVKPQHQAIVEKIKLTSGRPLYRKTFNGVDRAIAWLRQHPKALVELTIETDDFMKAGDQKRLLQSHDGIIRLIPKIKDKPGSHKGQNERVALDKTRQELFKDYFKSKNEGQSPNEEIMAIFKEILNYNENPDE